MQIAVVVRYKQLLDSAYELECHSDPRKLRKRVLRIRTVRIDRRYRLRQLSVTLVMVGHDRIYPERGSKRNLLHGGYSGIDRNNKARAACGDAADSALVHSVAL